MKIIKRAPICLITVITLTAAVLGSSLSGFGALVSMASADEVCPLSNPFYKDLRAAAAKLAEKVNIPPGCEDVQGQFDTINKGLSHAVTDFATLVIGPSDGQSQSGTPGNSETDPHTKASESNVPSPHPDGGVEGDLRQMKLKAVTDGFQALSGQITKYSTRSKCSLVFQNHMDYVEALVDVANSVSPYMIAFGGPQGATTALGVTIFGRVIQAVAEIFKMNQFDMSKEVQRRTFIENACAFYTFNQQLEGIERARMTKPSEKRAELEKANLELQTLTADPVQKLVAGSLTGIQLLEKANQLDMIEYQNLSDYLGGPRDDVQKQRQLCLVVRSKLEKFSKSALSFPGAAIQRLQELNSREKLTSPQARSKNQLVLDRLVSLSQIDKFPSSVISTAPQQQCFMAGSDWLEVIGELLAVSHDLIERAKTDFEKIDPPVRLAWEKSVSDAKAKLSRLQTSNDLVKQLSAAGSDIEESELNITQKTIRDTLFGDFHKWVLRPANWRLTRLSPAEAWLSKLYSSASYEIHDFKTELPKIEQDWLQGYPRPEDYLKADQDFTADPPQFTHPFGSKQTIFNQSPLINGCALIGHAAQEYDNAATESRAIHQFCETFRQIVDSKEYPRFAAYCTGLKFNAKTRQYERPPKEVHLALGVSQFSSDEGGNKAREKLENWFTRAKCQKSKEPNF